MTERSRVFAEQRKYRAPFGGLPEAGPELAVVGELPASGLVFSGEKLPVSVSMRSRLTREEALSFLLTHIVVEQQHSFEINATTLFQIMQLAAEAETRINKEEGVIPHEVIETIAREFIDQVTTS